MSYNRVLPRDLFNEAKLLKCLGQLSLLIHDGFGMGIQCSDCDGDSFDIRLNHLGYLFVSNIEFKYKNEYLFFGSLYNSKDNYPLILFTDECEEICVFDETGKFTEQFIISIKSFN